MQESKQEVIKLVSLVYIVAELPCPFRSFKYLMPHAANNSFLYCLSVSVTVKYLDNDDYNAYIYRIRPRSYNTKLFAIECLTWLNGSTKRSLIYRMSISLLF